MSNNELIISENEMRAKEKEGEILDPHKLELKPTALFDKIDDLSNLRQLSVAVTWQTVLAENKDTVSIIEHDDYIYAGNQNKIYKISKTGALDSSIEISNNKKEIRFAIHPEHLIIGSNGRVIAVPFSSFSDSSSHIYITLDEANDIVSVVVEGTSIFAGSNGSAYRISNWDGKGGTVCKIETNNLPGKRFHEVRLSLVDNYLVVGTYGFVVLIDKRNFKEGAKNIDISLPSCGYEIVSVQVRDNAIYAGSNGYVYKITNYVSKSPTIKKNSLSGRGNNPVEIDLAKDHLVVGINGYLVLVKLSDFDNDKVTKHISLPDCGYQRVSVKAAGNMYHVASNGYIYFDVEGSTYSRDEFSKHYVNFISDELGNLYFAADGTVYFRTTRKELPVKLIGQKTDQWCWAASAEMIMKYNGKNVDQCKQANDALRRTDCCLVPTPRACIEPGVANYPIYGFEFTNTQYGVAQEMNDMIQQINSNLPFSFSWRWKGGGGHRMVISGYSTEFNMVLVLDPWPVNNGERRWITYSSYAAGNDYTHGYDTINIHPKTKKFTIMKDAPQFINSFADQVFDRSKDAVVSGLNAYMKLESLTFDQDILKIGFGIPIHFISLEEVNSIDGPNQLLSSPFTVKQVVYPVFNRLTGELVFTVVIKSTEKGWQIDSVGGKAILDGLTLGAIQNLTRTQLLKLVTIPSIHHHILLYSDYDNKISIMLNIDHGQKLDHNLGNSIEAVWSNIKEKASNTRFED